MAGTEYYDHTTYPSQGAAGSSAALRAELDLVEAGFGKLPDLSGNGGKIVAVNSGGTVLEAIATTGTGSGVRAASPTLTTPALGVATATSVNKVAITAPATGATLALADGSTLATAGAYAATFTFTGATNLTFPTTGTLLTSSGSVSNLLGGAAGRIAYQSATDTTGFAAAGTSGQALVSGGTGAPTWTTGTLALAGNFSTAAAFSTSGANALTLTTTGPTNVTLPTSGTLANAGANTDITSLGILSGFLFGCTMSTAGSSATMSISAGKAQDSTGAQTMSLSAIAKTTSAWAVGTGNGGLDTGTIANSTWYHFYVIRRPDTGVVDAVFSTNATSPTLPANYTQYRRIGSGFTNVSAQWTSFVQNGDVFQWNILSPDIAANNPGTAAVLRTLTVPLGVSVLANLQLVVQNVAAAVPVRAYLTDLAIADIAPSTGLTDVGESFLGAGGVRYSGGRLSVRTNTSRQIRSRLDNSDVNTTLIINTLGWTDDRGRSA